MARFFIQLSYHGNAYHGWQLQENANTVQQVLNEKISVLLNQPIMTIGCGRTDTGVHARVFFAHFDTQESFDAVDFLFRLNNMLPHDIGVQRIVGVSDTDHSRFSATHREYQYFIHTRKDPFLQGQSWFQPFEFDVDAMNYASKLMMRHNDFASFCKAGGAQKTTICRIDMAHWERREHQLVFTIGADRFLRNMVRAVVGTMKEIGLGKLKPDAIDSIIESRSRTRAGASVPAHGLFLTNVTYPFL